MVLRVEHVRRSVVQIDVYTTRTETTSSSTVTASSSEITHGGAPTAETSHLRNNGHDFAAPRASLRANPRDATPRVLLVDGLLVLLVLLVLVLVDIRLVQDDTLWLQDGAGG